MIAGDDIGLIRVADYVFEGIGLEAVCQGCGRRRLVSAGGLLPRLYLAEKRLSDWDLERLSRRLVCGGCGERGPALTLGRFKT